MSQWKLCHAESVSCVAVSSSAASIVFYTELRLSFCAVRVKSGKSAGLTASLSNIYEDFDNHALNICGPLANDCHLPCPIRICEGFEEIRHEIIHRFHIRVVFWQDWEFNESTSEIDTDISIVSGFSMNEPHTISIVAFKINDFIWPFWRSGDADQNHLSPNFNRWACISNSLSHI